MSKGHVTLASNSIRSGSPNRRPGRKIPPPTQQPMINAVFRSGKSFGRRFLGRNGMGYSTPRSPTPRAAPHHHSPSRISTTAAMPARSAAITTSGSQALRECAPLRSIQDVLRRVQEQMIQSVDQECTDKTHKQEGPGQCVSDQGASAQHPASSYNEDVDFAENQPVLPSHSSHVRTTT